MFEGEELIPVCPEQLGGLSTPRPPAEIVGGDGADVLDGCASVITVEGEDKTREFLRRRNIKRLRSPNHRRPLMPFSSREARLVAAVEFITELSLANSAMVKG